MLSTSVHTMIIRHVRSQQDSNSLPRSWRHSLELLKTLRLRAPGVLLLFSTRSVHYRREN